MSTILTLAIVLVTISDVPFDFEIINRSDLTKEINPLQEYSPVILHFCLPLSGFISIECSKEIGEYSYPGEEILENAKIFMRYRENLHEFQLRRPYFHDYCKQVTKRWAEIINQDSHKEGCFEASYLSQRHSKWWIWQLERISSRAGQWSLFIE